MNDERRTRDIAGLEDRISRLPQEIAPHGELWSAIASTIRSDVDVPGLSRLATEVAPTTDLWPDIAARIHTDADDHDDTGRWQLASLLVACIAALAVGMVLLPGQIGFENGAENPDGSLIASTNAQRVATELLLTSDDGNDVTATQDIFREHIAIAREQREQIEASMQEYPNDTTLRTLWQYAYETELGLIDEAGRILTTI